MAIFEYQNAGLFLDVGGGLYEFDRFTNDRGTLVDGDADTTFEADDEVDGGVSLGQTYAGLVEVGGEMWPAFLRVNGDLFVYFSSGVPEPTELVSITPGSFNTICFGEGTLIATPGGAVAVEALRIDDLVLTEDGRAVPVTWVGRQGIVPLFQRLRLIRIVAGALGDGIPMRDLVVTADHALMLERVLVNAGALVNGSTVTEVPASKLPERVTVYHIETEAHDIILAEGVPAETYIDYAGRRVFDNYAEYVALYGEERGIVENPAPRVTCARMLPPALKARLGISRAA